MTRITPPLDPLAHRAAIDALEAQRAAYRRYARTVEFQQHSLGNGDGDVAAAVVDEAARGFDELDAGARRLAPLVTHAQQVGSGEQLLEVQRHMDELMREARRAESAIHNLTSQLEAWRDAYGQQLAALGLSPGDAPDGAPDPGAAAPGRRSPYTQPGFGVRAQHAPAGLFDRKG
jgi:hypothetical protein